ncbi:hypothetical protein scyTo_0012928 [Scyliorhinus torazame]|uniref:Uncharacterized protein n=1 Tax=Scyliorhinus torazame TaxID=75743 RepID=A0A401NKU1_SCYTO|nr:hypothetical protein [Scyliorhinus torazame]
MELFHSFGKIYFTILAFIGVTVNADFYCVIGTLTREQMVFPSLRLLAPSSRSIEDDWLLRDAATRSEVQQLCKPRQPPRIPAPRDT